MIFIYVLFFFLILFIIFFVLNFFLSFKNNTFIKVGFFESGFFSVGKSLNSFSIHFFLMLMIFVVFDLEIIIFVGTIVSDSSVFFCFLFIILFILFGFYLEWYFGKMIWML